MANVEIGYNFWKEVLAIESHWVELQYSNIVSDFSIGYNCSCIIVPNVKIQYTEHGINYCVQTGIGYNIILGLMWEIGYNNQSDLQADFHQLLLIFLT